MQPASSSTEWAPLAAIDTLREQVAGSVRLIVVESCITTRKRKAAQNICGPTTLEQYGLEDEHLSVVLL